ncbi:meteorin-like isoform X1 [Lampetra fluviatilis]
MDLLLLLLGSAWLCAEAAPVSDEPCSWTGSGLSQNPRSVSQIYLRCTQGSVDWLYPQGALQIQLPVPPPPSPAATAPATLPGDPGAGEASLCVRAARGSRGASVFAEQPWGLELLLAEAEAPGRVRCTPLPLGRIYVQAAPQTDISRHVARFRFELRAAGDTNGVDAGRDECRPCTDAEILRSACSSDFVIGGHILSVHPDRDADEAVIAVRVARVYRHRGDVDHRLRRLLLPPPAGDLSVGNATGAQEPPPPLLLVRTPLRCGARAGRGEFLLAGSLHFGRPRLDCAPRLPDFRRAYERAAGAGPCEIDVG